MIGYIFNKETLQMASKIDNITSIINNEIFGDEIVKLGNNYDYIVLESDTINLTISDTINLTGLVDNRDYFLLSENERKFKQLEEKNNKLQSTNAEILFALMNGGMI